MPTAAGRAAEPGSPICCWPCLRKAIVDTETQEILGATVLGIEGGEVMSVLEMAMMGHTKYTVLRDGVFAHPTLSESQQSLFSLRRRKIIAQSGLVFFAGQSFCAVQERIR
jgi:hypothetical protein